MKGLIILNFKNYLEISGEKTLELAYISKEVSKKYNIDIILAPPIPTIYYLNKSIDLPIISQHVDNENLGSTTGYIIPELAKSYGAIGSLINHSEHRLDYKTIEQLVNRLKTLDMISIVCASDVIEVGIFAKFNPDMIAIEPPELIGTGKAVSKVRPSVITESVVEAKKYSRSKIICGAGIVDKSDIIGAIGLGSQGILIASGIVKSKSWEKKLSELAEAF
ncbi:MAG: triose-phosphate isomerase [Nitrososphaeraceae archaeon]